MTSAHYCRHIFLGVFLLCSRGIGVSTCFLMFSFERNSSINAEFWMSKIRKISQLTIDWLVFTHLKHMFWIISWSKTFKISRFRPPSVVFPQVDCHLIDMTVSGSTYTFHRAAYDNDEMAKFHFSGPALVSITSFRTWLSSRWWFHIFFHLHRYLGKIPILTNIFQMGWNHQPVLMWRF